jgi:hypothetical protein
MTSRPLFAFAIVHTWHEFEGSYASTVTQVKSRQFFASAAGAEFAFRKSGLWEDDHEEVFGRIEKLQPGTVYNHQTNRWEPGMCFKPWFGDQPERAPWTPQVYDDGMVF